MREAITALINAKQLEIERIRKAMDEATYPSDKEMLRVELSAVSVYSTQLMNILIEHKDTPIPNADAKCTCTPFFTNVNCPIHGY